MNARISTDRRLPKFGLLGCTRIREYENMRIREYAYTSIHCIQYEVKVSAQVSSTGWEKQRWLVAIKFNILKGQNGKNGKNDRAGKTTKYQGGKNIRIKF